MPLARPERLGEGEIPEREGLRWRRGSTSEDEEKGPSKRGRRSLPSRTKRAPKLPLLSPLIDPSCTSRRCGRTPVGTACFPLDQRFLACFSVVENVWGRSWTREVGCCTASFLSTLGSYETACTSDVRRKDEVFFNDPRERTTEVTRAEKEAASSWGVP